MNSFAINGGVLNGSGAHPLLFAGFDGVGLSAADPFGDHDGKGSGGASLFADFDGVAAAAASPFDDHDGKGVY